MRHLKLQDFNRLFVTSCDFCAFLEVLGRVNVDFSNQFSDFCVWRLWKNFKLLIALLTRFVD